MENLISLCMIVKNEEQVIARCLSSVQHLVDEIIIVDTGSTDNTKQIASQFTNHVYDFEWNSNFAEARNKSIRHATGRWILVLDADEYLETNSTDSKQLRDYLSTHNTPQPKAYNVRILNFTDSGYDETKFMESSNPRIFNNFRQISYTQPIHEQLTSSLGKIRFEKIPFTVYHSGYTHSIVQQKNKSQRNMSILQTMQQGKEEDPYFQFILGNEYMNMEQPEKALAAYTLSLDKSTSNDAWYHHLLDRLITVELQQEYYLAAYRHIEIGINCKPKQTDYYCLKGILLDSLGFFKKATSEFERCIQLADLADKNKEPYWIVQPLSGIITPLQMLGEIYRKKGDIANAIQYWIRVLANQPKNYRVLQQLVDHLTEVESKEQIIDILSALYPKENAINSILLLKILLNNGHPELIDYYKKLSDFSGIQLNANDLLQLKLYSGSLLEIESDEVVDPHLSIMAAWVDREAAWAERASSQKDLCHTLIQIGLEVITEKEVPTLPPDHEQLLARTLFLMWKYNYKDIYFALIQQIANAKTLNILVGMFYDSGRLNDTLELLDLLLKNQLLDSAGLTLLSQWYINMGEFDEAYTFIMASCNDNPTINTFGIISENFKDHQKRELLPIFFKKHSEIQSFSL